MARRGPPCVEARSVLVPHAHRERTAAGHRTRRSPRRQRDALVLVAALLLAAGAALTGTPAGRIAAHAATIVVTSASDSGPGSLRTAIASAADGATITFAPGLDGTPITLSSGEIDTSRNLTITGNGAGRTIIDGSNKVRILAEVGGTMAISGVTIRDGRVALAGVNVSGAGGALVEGNGSLTITDSTVTGNTTVAQPGGTALGGGLAAESGGSLTLVRTAVTGNQTSGAGGGIEADSHTSLTVVDSTVSGNTAGSAGGGLADVAATGVTLISATIAGNTAPAGSGIHGAASLQDTIVANTPATNCSTGVSSRGHDLDTGSSCGLAGAGDLSATDPRLGPLQGNGGPTPTQALPAGSPAIGAGGTCPAQDDGVDQRGQPRKQPCDIGAFETAPAISPAPLEGHPAPPTASTATPALGPGAVPPPAAGSSTTSSSGGGARGAAGAPAGGPSPPSPGPSPAPSAPPAPSTGGTGGPGRRATCSSCPPPALRWLGSVEDLRQVSTSAPVLLTNAALTAGVLLLIPFPSQLFNRTLAAHADEVRSWLRFLPRRRDPSGTGSGTGWSRLLLFTLAAAALYALLDPGLAFDVPSLAVYLGTVLALLTVTLGFSLPGVLHHRVVHGVTARLRALPWTLPIAAVCVLISRLVQVHPGYIYGLVAGWALGRTLSKRAEGRAAALSAAVLGAVTAVAWAALTPVKQAAQRPGAGFGVLVLDTMLAMVVTAGLQSMAFGLVPLRFLQGERIIVWSRAAWAGLFGLGMFGLFHVLLDPQAGHLATAPGGVVTVIGLFVAYGALSVALWAYFRFRRPPATAPGNR